MVLVGHVARPHGVRGAVRARPTGETLGSLSPGERVVVGETEYELAGLAGTIERPILTLVGVESREDALAIGRQPIQVTLDRLPPVGDETFYVRDLVGCAVVEGEQRIGTVVDVESAPANDMLVVDGEQGRLLVALVEETVEEVDLDARRITVLEGRAVALPGGR